MHRLLSQSARAAAVLLAFVCAGVPVQAGSLEEAHGLYRDGAYLEAADCARDAEGGAPGAPELAYAARAILAAVVTDPFGAQRGVHVEEAERLARAAIAADAQHLEGHLQLVVALGYRGRAMTPSEARASGLVETSKHHIDIALDLAPNDAFALAVAGAWELEVIARAGGFWGGLLYGASFERGVERFEAAEAADPEAVLFPVQYATALLGLGVKEEAGRARPVLERAVAARPRDALDRFFQAEARVLLAALDAGDFRTAKRQVAKLQGRTAPDAG